MNSVRLLIGAVALLTLPFMASANVSLFGVEVGSNFIDAPVEHRDVSANHPQADGTKLYRFLPKYSDGDITKFRFYKAYTTPISNLVAVIEMQSIVDLENDCELAKKYILDTRLNGTLKSFKTIEELKQSGFDIKANESDALIEPAQGLVAQFGCSEIEEPKTKAKKSLLSATVFSQNLLKRASFEKGQLVAMGQLN